MKTTRIKACRRIGAISVQNKKLIKKKKHITYHCADKTVVMVLVKTIQILCVCVSVGVVGSLRACYT